jgi:glucose-6-phosphate 1-epimerase
LSSSDDILALDHKFSVPGLARVIGGRGSLPKVVVATPAATGEIYLHGAHVTSWKPNGAGEVFYLSPNAIFTDGKAIRGGVPISFPWFADKASDPTAPAHGFVRTKAWQLSSIEAAGTAVIVTMSTESNDVTRNSWPSDFRLACRATFGAQLEIELIVTNTNKSSFTFEEALHAYYRVGNVEAALLEGLDSTSYLDKTDQRKEKKEACAVRLSSEADRVYLNTPSPLALVDASLKRRINISKENSQTTVVWNPWKEKSSNMADLGPDQWKKFLCIETTNVAPYAIELAPGQQHSMSMLVTCETREPT